MNDRLLRRGEVEEITGLARSSIYRYMQEGDFPRPVRVGPAAVRWRESDIVRWLESRPTARGEIGPLPGPGLVCAAKVHDRSLLHARRHPHPSKSHRHLRAQTLGTDHAHGDLSHPAFEEQSQER